MFVSLKSEGLRVFLVGTVLPIPGLQLYSFSDEVVSDVVRSIIYFQFWLILIVITVVNVVKKFRKA
jgi:hypothetical protein